jgi:hypothetical protein
MGVVGGQAWGQGVRGAVHMQQASIHPSVELLVCPWWLLAARKHCTHIMP